jgi:hypothetical protein
MDTTHHDWAPQAQSKTTETPDRLPWLGTGENTQYGPQPLEGGDVELSRLGGYAMVIALMAGCMLLSAWSRIDLRETAVGLDRFERAYTAAQAETTRLELEISTLEDPAWLTQSAAQLSLLTTVPVIELTQPPSQ